MFRECLEVTELLSDLSVAGGDVAALFPSGTDLTLTPVASDVGMFDFIRVDFPGREGKIARGSAPTVGVLGQLGGLRIPGIPGLASEADGAIVALAVALRMARMRESQELFLGDVIVTTHVCQHAVLEPREPYPFVMPPVPFRRLLDHHIDPAMDAILTVETARGNRFVCHKGFAITQPAREGIILPASPDLLRLMEHVTGEPPVVYPVSMQDITPWDNGVYHSTLLMAPATVCDIPVVGVGLTSETAPTGFATNVADSADQDAAARFCLKVAEQFGVGHCRFHDPDEFDRLSRLYGTPGTKFHWAPVA